MTRIDIYDNNLTEFSWDGCPSSLTEISLNNNNLTEFSFRECPTSLTVISLSGNNLDFNDFNWDFCPEFLFCYDRYSNLNKYFAKYKSSGQYFYIPPYKYISSKKKDLNDELIRLSLCPPGIFSEEVFYKGGVLYHEGLKEAMEIIQSFN